MFNNAPFRELQMERLGLLCNPKKTSNGLGRASGNRL
jgi:hypothetical protein